MKNIRIGNDIKIEWSLFDGGSAFILEGRDVKVYLKDKYGRKEITDYVISGNMLTWTFLGKNQRRTGAYSLELVVNENENGMITTDACQFVNLVHCSCDVAGSDDNGVSTETIELRSSLSVGGNSGGGGGSYDDTAIWKAVNNKVDKVAGKGLSTNDYTNEEKQKLAGLENYDDSGIKKDIKDLSKKVEDLEKNKIVVDNDLNADSDNPISNKLFTNSFTYLGSAIKGVGDGVTALETEVSNKEDKPIEIAMSGEPADIVVIDTGVTYYLNKTNIGVSEEDSYEDYYQKILGGNIVLVLGNERQLSVNKSVHEDCVTFNIAPQFTESGTANGSITIHNSPQTAPNGAEYYIEVRIQITANNGGGESGGGSNVEVDAELSNTSKNPVQNKVIATALTELSAEVGKKQDTITDLETIRSGAEKGATAIQEVKTINGQSIVGSGNIEIQGGGGGGMTTPSGDPMHYMYKAVGAEWNGTGADIEKQGVYGDTITHKAGYWYLNELGDITTEEMRQIYLYANLDNGAKGVTKYLAGIDTRTNIATWSSSWNGKIKDQETFSYAYNIIVARMRNKEHYIDTNASFAFTGCTALQKILPTLDATSTTSFNGTFDGCKNLREVRIKNIKVAIKFNSSPLISKASILYLIQNSAATSAMVITLHADAYARLAEDADIVAALAEKTNVSLAK